MNNPDLFNQSERDTVEDTFCVYTNNNNLRHYYSSDKILAREMFITNLYDSSPSTLISNALILFKQSPIRNFIDMETGSSSNDTLFPIALELRFNDLSGVECFLVSTDYKVQKGFIQDFQPSNHLVAVLFYPLPFQIITRIVFREKSELLNFRSAQMRNIYLDDSIFTCDSSYFNGLLELDTNKLVNSFKILSLPNTEYIHGYKLNKLKGMLLCIMQTFECKIGADITLNFDPIILKIIQESLLIPKYEFAKDFELLISIIKKKSKYPAFKDVIFEKKDPTPLESLDVIKVIRNIINPDEVYDLKLYYNDDTIEEGFDRYLCLSIIRELYNLNPKEFEQSSFAKSIKKMFLNSVHDYYKGERPATLDELKDRYSKAFELIFSIMQGVGGKISDVLIKWPRNFYSLKAFLFFLLNFQEDRSEQLKLYMTKFELTEYDKRLIWLYFGLLNGISPIDLSFKKDKKLLSLIDEMVDTIINPKIGLNTFFNYPTQLSKKNYLIKHLKERKDNDNNVNEFEIVNGIGISFLVKHFNIENQIHSKLLSYLSSSKFLEKVKDILIKHKSSKGYITWQIDLPHETTLLHGKIMCNEEPRITLVWKDWRKFEQRFISDSNEFFKTFDNDTITKIKNLLKE